MEYHNIHSTSNNGERVTSSYAEIYFNDTYCDNNKDVDNNTTFKDLKHQIPHKEDNDENKSEWVSPSDLLIGIIELKPPFTSKITRGKTHEGILAIGNSILDKKRARFLSSLTKLLEDNDAAWNQILLFEKQKVITKVKAILAKIFKYKSEIMKREISFFYENSLQELEEHLQSEVQVVLQSTRANIISYLNNEIQLKLRKERKVLASALAQRYNTEVHDLRKYYEILLNNELNRNKRLLNKAFNERNDAIKAFYRQIECKKLTSTMYIMSSERKKCKMKKYILENFQSAEITEKLRNIRNREDEIEALNKKDVQIVDINKQWEEKIKKILGIYLKFISFSLKLLPEQTTFLLDLEKMVVLQLNEIQKNPNMKSTVLFEDHEQLNVFDFLVSKQEISVCEKKPFVVTGDVLAGTIPPQFGSCETLPSDVDLPYFRFNRQYVYAKCHGFESIKKFLDSHVSEYEYKEPDPHPLDRRSKVIDHPIKTEISKEIETTRSESSIESLLIEDFARLQECPVKKCCDWIKRDTFPYLASYLDYNQDNFKRVTAILGQTPEKEPPPELISVRDIAKSELPFAETKELNRTVETQYSSQEDLTLVEITCPCVSNTLVPQPESHYRLKTTSSEALHEILVRRRYSIQRLIDHNPKLLKIFTDECFDYKL